MFTKQQERELCGFALYIENHEEEFKYQLLDRLRCDCKYFLYVHYILFVKSKT